MRLYNWLLILALIAGMTTIKAQTSTEISLWVNGNCGMCEDRIEQVALGFNTVNEASWDAETKTLRIKVDPGFDQKALEKELGAAGHDTESVRAEDHIYADLHTCCQYRVSNTDSNSDAIESSFFVDGICEMCQDRIHKVVLGQEHVLATLWNIQQRTLYVDHSPEMDMQKLKQAIADAGHDTDEIKAPQEAYDNIHACCKYRDAEIIAAHRPNESVVEEQESSISESDTLHSFLFVDGICEMCQERIETAALNQKHIYSAYWDIGKQRLYIDHGEYMNLKKLQKSLAKAGHDTDDIKASDKAYDAIHECCKYRDPEIRAAHASDDTTDHGLDSKPGLLHGIILERDNTGTETPLVGANVYWSGTTTGAVSDIDGYFSLDKQGHTHLVVSYIGYDTDTLDVTEKDHIEIVMSDAATMREVTITGKKRSTDVSYLAAGKVQRIGEKELLKAACCNLSESFETNPTVDASMTDAVTGTKQIKMLGLAGPNIQITREGIPDIRGLSALYGLSFTPGTWIQGININTGTGSVVNGFESIAGQIDVALKKPEHSEKLLLNVYTNEMSRTELNANYSKRFSDNLSTGVMLHGSIMPTRHDVNNDGFLDHPNMEMFVGLNRWKWHGKNGLEGQFGFKLTKSDSRSGQVAFDHESDHGSDTYWGSRIKLDKYEGWAKIGKVFPSRPYASIGLQLAASYYDQEAYFGQRNYNGNQGSTYANLIYQSIITDTRHQFKTGLSFQWDRFEETVVLDQYDRNETVSGGFFEYTFKPDERFSLVAGLRGDYHNNYGFFVTPRLHLRYAPNESTVFRLSGGRGQRTASIFAENIGLFASSRQIMVQSEANDNPYGLNPEVSWSGGFSIVKEWQFAQRPILFQFDVYHTNFENQIVVDWDASPQEIHFYNLDGKSYSNSVQFQVDYEIIPRLDMRVAYRMNDVQTTYGDEKLQKPLTARDRAFVNLQYTTDNSWSFDFTINWQGSQRLPNTSSNPEAYQIDQRSPDYFMINTQISKSWNKKFDVYIGAMNLFDYTQDNPIISPDNPFSDYFDASIIWAPVFGREIYGGIRYRIL